MFLDFLSFHAKVQMHILSLCHPPTPGNPARYNPIIRRRRIRNKCKSNFSEPFTSFLSSFAGAGTQSELLWDQSSNLWLSSLPCCNFKESVCSRLLRAYLRSISIVNLASVFSLAVMSLDFIDFSFGVIFCNQTWLGLSCPMT